MTTRLIVALCLVNCAAAHAAIATPCTSSDTCHTQEWRFKVLLDDKPIGYHRFALNRRGEAQYLTSEARFNVKLWFINAYTYAHDAVEVWQDQCLQRLQADTNDNGDRTIVRGERTDHQFVVARSPKVEALDTCVQTFAYWNPTILSATRLLNPQTGEYVPVAVTALGADTISVRGQSREAIRYRLLGQPAQGAPMQIDLWYSPDQQWLALESKTGGRRLRYLQ